LAVRLSLALRDDEKVGGMSMMASACPSAHAAVTVESTCGSP